MSILRTHYHDGTAGTSATAVGEGYDTLTGTAPVYVNGGFSGQALRWTAGAAAALLGDNQASANYMGFYVNFSTALPTSDWAIAMVTDASSGNQAALGVNSAGHVFLYNALSTLVATSSLSLTVGSYARIEWNVYSGGQEARIFLSPNSPTQDETLTGAAAALTPGKYRVGCPWTGKKGTSGDTVDIDQVVIADAWPALGVVSNWTYGREVRIG